MVCAVVGNDGVVRMMEMGHFSVVNQHSGVCPQPDSICRISGEMRGDPTFLMSEDYLPAMDEILLVRFIKNLEHEYYLIYSFAFP